MRIVRYIARWSVLRRPALEEVSFLHTMWRAFFCAIGAMLVIIGIECLLIDSATLASGVVDEPQPSAMSYYAPTSMATSRIFKPAEWMPWSCLACGAVVLLYALTLNRKWGEG